MRRLTALIAILIAFASLAGVTTAHAHRYVSTPLVVLNHVDEDNVPIRVVVKVQRGQIDLGAGIVMPCGPHHAIPVTTPTIPPAPECWLPAVAPADGVKSWRVTAPLRPPKLA